MRSESADERVYKPYLGVEVPPGGLARVEEHRYHEP